MLRHALIACVLVVLASAAIREHKLGEPDAVVPEELVWRYLSVRVLIRVSGHRRVRAAPTQSVSGASMGPATPATPARPELAGSNYPSVRSPLLRQPEESSMGRPAMRPHPGAVHHMLHAGGLREQPAVDVLHPSQPVQRLMTSMRGGSSLCDGVHPIAVSRDCVGRLSALCSLFVDLVIVFHLYPINRMP